MDYQSWRRETRGFEIEVWSVCSVMSCRIIVTIISSSPSPALRRNASAGICILNLQFRQVLISQSSRRSLQQRRSLLPVPSSSTINERSDRIIIRIVHVHLLRNE